MIKLNFFISICIFLVLAPWSSPAQLPDIDAKTVTTKLEEIMQVHVSHKVLDKVIIKRALKNYTEELDPIKTYFIESDVHTWIDPPDSLLQQVLQNYRDSNFTVFEEIHAAMINAIERRNRLEKKVASAELPKKVLPSEFKDLKWATSEEELLDRLIRIRALQLESMAKLDGEQKELSLQRIEKRRAKFEEEFLSKDVVMKERFILSNILKATASALDAHTAYFTPGEATQFMINVQQRLFGIGAQLRDDLNGFTVTKIVEGGPAARSGELKLKDRIIAVNDVPVVGMDIVDAVDLIRGEENTPVKLKVVREISTESSSHPKKEEILDISLKRGEVVLKESRLESALEPYGDGIIAYLRLFSFYQDPESSSAGDITKEIERLKQEYKIKGVILDLRSNSGGLLTQAVAVTGLFITKGIVVSIKDDTSQIQHLRDMDNKMLWDGPLLVLINRASASAAEIVAQTLQDYGRAIIVGDDHTFGKGSFQTFTLNTDKNGTVNPQGEFKITRGIYYTVSGKSPQLVGVSSDIVIPGPYSMLDIGERFAEYPLENQKIQENFKDDLADIPRTQREKVRRLYNFDLQPKLTSYTQHIDLLRKNSKIRIEENKNYQAFLKELKKRVEDKTLEEEDNENFGQSDLQLGESYNIMKDLILLLR